MNFEIFKCEDKSGRMSKESFVLKNYPEEFDEIIRYSENMNITELPFKEKVYLFLNQIEKLPKCSNIGCQNNVKFVNSSIGYREYCSTKCISSDSKIKEIKKQKSIEKFGTSTPAQSQKVKDKIKKTNQSKYGGNSPMSADFVKNKSIETLQKNFGVDNPSKSKEILKSRVESFKSNLDNFKSNYEKTSLLKYGVSHPWKNKTVHKKTIYKFYQNYRDRIESKIKGTDFHFIDFFKDKSTELLFSCKKCVTEFSINTYQFYYRVNNKLNICTNCHPISESSSLSQIELLYFIKRYYQGEILENCKLAIAPYEIDIFLPELNLAFEFNGIWWHSSKYKDKDYHLKKLNLCQQKNIKLITIWEDDWQIKRDICESFILNKLSLSNRIMARKCLIKSIDYNTSKKFLDENHFQGDCKSSIRLALFYQEEIVCLMTFSKLRLPLGGRNQEGTWELTRFCNKNFNTTIGGASKLLNFFILEYNPVQIQTYSDNLISDGNMYDKLGFTYIHTSDPGYWYVINGKREHRFNWRKDKLKKIGADITKTESQIMEEWGYHKLYNGGNKKWILNNIN